MSKLRESIQLCCENSLDTLYFLESIVKTTKESCQYKELNSTDFDINLYVNMLTLALDKIASLKMITEELEESLYTLN